MGASFEEIMAELYSLENAANRAGMARFGVGGAHVLGISVNTLRRIARKVGRKKHEIALRLWDTGIHEARILASIVDDPAAVDEEQMERWVRDFDSWDICDQCCGNLFDKTPYAWDKAVEWSSREAEFEKRAAFALIAYLAVHAKRAPDDKLTTFLDLIRREAGDGRNYVKKAVSWALREIGKRSLPLNEAAIATAQAILRDAEQTGKRGGGRWVALDALRELQSERTRSRIR